MARLFFFIFQVNYFLALIWGKNIYIGKSRGKPGPPPQDQMVTPLVPENMTAVQVWQLED